MWINKNKYENMKAKITELENRIDNLVRMGNNYNQCINKLMNIHDLYITTHYSEAQRGIKLQFNRNIHPEQVINLGDINDLTFTELAEYVIDGKPITRIRKHKVVVCPKENKCEENTNNDGNN